MERTLFAKLASEASERANGANVIGVSYHQIEVDWGPMTTPPVSSGWGVWGLGGLIDWCIDKKQHIFFVDL